MHDAPMSFEFFVTFSIFVIPFSEMQAKWNWTEKLQQPCIHIIHCLPFIFFLIRITAKIDDDMLSYYCNEDIFLLEVRQLEEDLFDITLTELPDHVSGK